MITIRALFSEINISNSEEYAIYKKDYAADRFGNPLPDNSEEVKLGHFYEYGDIIIETVSKRYTLTRIYCAYDWLVALLDQIDAKRNDGDVFIDLNQLIELSDGSFKEFDCSELLVDCL